MKKLFLALFIPLFIIAGIPALFLAIMYDGKVDEEMPVHLYHANANAMSMLYEQLDVALEEVREDDANDLVYNLHQDILNTAIFTAIRDEFNAQYLPTEGCASSACQYVLEEVVELGDESLYMRVVGVWSTFEDERVTLNVALEVQRGEGFTYKTTVRTRLILRDTDDAYDVQFDRFQIGSLPLTQGMFSSVIRLVDRVSGGLDLDNLESQLPAGNLEISEFKYSIRKSEITELLDSDDADDAMMNLAKEMLDIIFENRLVRFELRQDVFAFEFRMSLLRSADETDIPEYLHDMRNPDGSYNEGAFDGERYMRNRFDEFVFSYALTGNQEFILRERTFNRLLYDTFSGFEDLRMQQVIYEGEDNERTMHIGVEGMWLNVRDDYVRVKVLFAFDDIKSLMEITADNVSSDPTLYMYDLSTITVGKDAGETSTGANNDYLLVDRLEAFKSLLSDLGDFYVGYVNDDGMLIIDVERLTDLMDDGINSGTVEVEEILITDRQITLKMRASDPALQQALDAYSQALGTAFSNPLLDSELQNALNTTDEGPEQDTYNQAMLIQQKQNDSEPLTQEDVDTLFASYDQMSPEAQQAFMSTFQGLVDPSIFDDFNSGFYQNNQD